MVAAVWLAALAGAALAQQPAAKPLSQQLQQEYQEAFQFYSSGHYQKAVLKWELILEQDPQQASARAMIGRARRTIWALTRVRQRQILGLIAGGRFQQAQVALQPFLDLDPDDPRLESFRQRLQSVVEIVPTLARSDAASRAAVIAMTGYLDFVPDYQLAYDGLRYALERTRKAELYRKLEDLVISDQPQLADDEVTPGLTLIDYKQRAALNDIYDGRYSGAIKILVEIIKLEPRNVPAWERLGSAYYCLGLKAKAAVAWKEALRLSPNDPSLRQFLVRRRPLKCGPR